MRIEAEDILKSRVFADPDEGMYGQSGNGAKGEEVRRPERGRQGRGQGVAPPYPSVGLQHRVVAQVGEQGVGSRPDEHH